MKRRVRACARGRTGLTILELIVSLVVGSVALLGATTLFLGLSGKAQWLVERSDSEDREGNGDRVLRSLAANLTANRLGTAGLVADSTRFQFTSWCDDPWGGAVACSVSLTTSADSAGGAELIMVPGGASSPTARAVLWKGRRVILGYLVDPAAGGRWERAWSGGVAPRALGVMVDGDTLIFPFGHGG